MSKTEHARYVKRELSERHIDSHWERIQELRKSRTKAAFNQRRRGFLILGLAGAAVASVVVALWFLGLGFRRSERMTPSAWSGTVLESGATAQSVRLKDGSKIIVAPESRVALCEVDGPQVCLRVEYGKARFSVKRTPGRQFTVRVADVEVRVVGTSFTVSRSKLRKGEEVQVAVSEGVVEVRGPGVVQRLAAGDRWVRSTDGTTRVETSSDGVLETEDDLGRIEDGKEEGEVKETEIETEAEEPGSDGIKDGSRENGRTGRLPGERTGRVESVDALWNDARRARSEGRYRDTERIFARILKDFPSGGQSALAAFALGQLRMDVLGDPAGAVAPLRRAVAAGRGSSFHEDALSRLAQAYNRTGKTNDCIRTHRRYLTEYPEGVHRKRLARICPLP